MGKNRSPERVFELPAHFTEWSGREGGPVGYPLAQLYQILKNIKLYQ
jgi:hypothetical protein